MEESTGFQAESLDRVQTFFGRPLTPVVPVGLFLFRVRCDRQSPFHTPILQLKVHSDLRMPRA
jgi:hypothetical protein